MLLRLLAEVDITDQAPHSALGVGVCAELRTTPTYRDLGNALLLIPWITLAKTKAPPRRSDHILASPRTTSSPKSASHLVRSFPYLPKIAAHLV